MIAMEVFLLSAVVVALIAAVIDWRTGTIPNLLTFGALAAAPVAHFLSGYLAGGFSAGGEALLRSVAGALVCAIIPVVLFVTGGMFGGDVKLLAAIGALVGLHVGIEIQFYAFIAAALYAPARLAYEGKLLRTLGNTLLLLTNPFRPRTKRKDLPREMLTEMRFGPSVAVGACLGAFFGWRGLV